VPVDFGFGFGFATVKNALRSLSGGGSISRAAHQSQNCLSVLIPLLAATFSIVHPRRLETKFQVVI
jgi:hypothetical protein